MFSKTIQRNVEAESQAKFERELQQRWEERYESDLRYYRRRGQEWGEKWLVGQIMEEKAAIEDQANEKQKAISQRRLDAMKKALSEIRTRQVALF